MIEKPNMVCAVFLIMSEFCPEVNSAASSRGPFITQTLNDRAHTPRSAAIVAYYTYTCKIIQHSL